MEVGATNQSNTIPPAAEVGIDRGTTAISSDFETFIKMLTVQMENQDPLNPVEASDFAVQLATFSSVEQQVLTNNLLTSLGAQIGAQSVAQLAGWIGMEARADMPVEFDGAPVTLSLKPESLADSVELVVKNSQGVEVARQNAPLQPGEFEWVGADDQGTPLPTGTYEIELESFSADELIGQSAVQVHGIIAEARNDDGIPTLKMISGQTVTSSQILGLSNPDT